MQVPGLPATLLVASRNPAKINAARVAVERCFPGIPLSVRGIEAASGVADQPIGDQDTLQGAINRINNLRSVLCQHQQQQQQSLQPPQPQWQLENQICCDAEAQHLLQLPNTLLAAVEGGVLLRDDDMYCFAWAAAKLAGAEGISTARSAEFLLPRRLSKLVLEGMELGQADDFVFGRTKSGQGTGTVGKLTANAITRTCYYEHAFIMALIPFMNPELYPEYF